MKKIIMILILMINIVFLFSCDMTSNEIYNKSYDVNIDLTEIENAFVPAVEKAISAVVGVSLYERANFLRQWEETAVGSGVIYKGIATMKDGSIVTDITQTKESDDVNFYTYYLITNHHVIATSTTESKVKVYVPTIELLYDGTVLGENIIEDLAVVTFETTLYLQPIEFGNSDELEQGEIVIAIGNPEGYEFYSSVTTGVVSFRKRYVEVERDTNSDGRNDWTGYCEYIQHDAAINPGNSGGALININGELIGVNTLKLIDAEDGIEGMGFAVPVNIVVSNLSDLEIGVTEVGFTIDGKLYSYNEICNRDIFQDVPNIDISDYDYLYGVYVFSLIGKNYNLKSGDIIMEINNEKVYSVASLSPILRKYKKSDTILCKVFRDNQILEIQMGV